MTGLRAADSSPSTASASRACRSRASAGERAARTTFASFCSPLVFGFPNLISGQVPFLFNQRVLKFVAFVHASKETPLVALRSVPDSVVEQSYGQAPTSAKFSFC